MSKRASEMGSVVSVAFRGVGVWLCSKGRKGWCTAMQRITRNDLVLNTPLPWPLYDQHGNLLMHEGYVLSIPQHVEALLQRGAFIQKKITGFQEAANTAPDASLTTLTRASQTAFHRVDRLANTLERLHKDLWNGSVRSDMRMSVMGMANVISHVCEYDADAVLAALHTQRSHSYLIAQQLLGAAVTEILARDAKVDEVRRTSWVCAALTRDIGMLEMQWQLDSQAKALSSDQIRGIQHHPHRAVHLLEQMGVSDLQWLQVVQQHQERCDGSGYPGNLTSEDIQDGAKLLAVADSYAAMVTPRLNRGAQQPKQAMQNLQAASKHQYDADWVARLIRCLTLYPPGSLVELANGELAAVRVTNANPRSLQGWPIQNEEAMGLMASQFKSIGQTQYAVVQLLGRKASKDPAQRGAESF